MAKTSCLFVVQHEEINNFTGVSPFKIPWSSRAAESQTPSSDPPWVSGCAAVGSRTRSGCRTLDARTGASLGRISGSNRAETRALHRLPADYVCILAGLQLTRN